MKIGFDCHVEILLWLNRLLFILSQISIESYMKILLNFLIKNFTELFVFFSKYVLNFMP